MGRFDEAAVEIRWASELDPLSLTINADLSAPLLFARQYDRAIESLLKTLEMDPLSLANSIGTREPDGKNHQQESFEDYSDHDRIPLYD